MKCNDIEILMQRYIDNELLDSQKKILEEHLQSCDLCQNKLLELEKLDYALSDYDEFEPPPSLDRKIMNNLPAISKPPLFSTFISKQIYNFAMVSFVTIFAFILGYSVPTLQHKNGIVKEVEIIFYAPQANSVAITGDFNDWDLAGNQLMKKEKNGPIWYTKLELKQGVYHYNFVIDGKHWIVDPKAETIVADGFGGENAVILVEG